MSIGVRIGSALLLGSLVGIVSLSARAEPSTWSDPPAREAATPPRPEVAEPPRPAPSDRAGAEPEAPRREAAARSRKVTEAAPIRRRADRAVVVRRQQARLDRSRPSPREDVAPPAPRRTVLHRPAPRPVPVEARREPRRYGPRARFAGDAYGPGSRRAGWYGLLGDERARRIERARAAGYLVMRARDVVYSDGSVVRTLRPLGPMGEDGFD